MDPITTAILAGIAAGATSVSKNALTDAYSALRELIRRRYGHHNALDKAVQDVEANPDSEGRRIVLKEEVTRAGANRVPELVTAAERVSTAVEASGDGAQIVQNIQAGHWINTGQIVVKDGSAFVAGDFRPTFINDLQPRYQPPKTPVGKFVGIPAVLCLFVGLGTAGVGAFSESSSVFMAGMAIFGVSFFVAIVAQFIDQS
jgi:hypothetical protein